MNEYAHELRNRWKEEKENSVFVNIDNVPYLFDKSTWTVLTILDHQISVIIIINGVKWIHTLCCFF